MDASGDDSSNDDFQPEITDLDPAGKVHKRRRLLKIIGSGVAAAAIISMIVYLIFFYFVPSPGKTLNTFCNALENKDYHTLSNQFSATASPHLSEADVRTDFQAPLARLGGVQNCTVGDIQESGSQATGVMTWGLGNGSTLVFHCRLSHEKEGWKVTFLTF